MSCPVSRKQIANCELWVGRDMLQKNSVVVEPKSEPEPVRKIISEQNVVIINLR